MCACLLDAFGVFDFVAHLLHFCLKVVCKMGGVISRDYGIYKCLLMCYVVLLAAVCSMAEESLAQASVHAHRTISNLVNLSNNYASLVKCFVFMHTSEENGITDEAILVE